MPVSDIPPILLSANVDIFGIAVSPILPFSFSNNPPVDVPATIFPNVSNATAPTVP